MASACLLTACGHLTTASASAEIPANLRQPCPQLPLLLDGDKATVLLWAEAAIDEYEACARRGDQLVEAWPK